jgi:hypothetical protein
MKLRKLIKLYQNDPLSSWHKLRYVTRRNQRNLLREIARKHGDVELRNIKARTLLEWHKEWLGDGKVAMSHALMNKLRAVTGFGFTILEDKQCGRLRQIMSTFRFPKAGKRRQRITADQAAAVIKAANKMDERGIAFAQALQFELMLRQKDVIGEWLPNNEPGAGIITDNGEKWVRGLVWEEIDSNLILFHQTSKTGKPVAFDLTLAPMVVAELRRRKQPTSGPVILDHKSDMPFKTSEFRRRWRVVAREAGVPDEVFNMDSRAGGVSEAFDAKADPDFIRATATHSDLATTQGYNRGGELAKSSQVLRARSQHRVDQPSRLGRKRRANP